MEIITYLLFCDVRASSDLDIEAYDRLAFANLYTEFACSFMARSLALPAEQFGAALPTVQDGVAGMQLIEAARRSNEQGGQWCPTDLQGTEL
jgi:hypothetical protein